MSAAHIRARRLAAQGISAPTGVTPAAVVRSLGAVQAQEYLESLWALGLRMPLETSDATIETAIADRSILRTWPMRGTVHYVAAEDAHWMLALLSRRVVRSAQQVYRRAGLDDATITKSRRILTRAFSNGIPVTRAELYATLERNGIAANTRTPVGMRGLHIIGRLALDGVLCFGPRRGKQPTFVLLDAWVGEPRALTGDEALAELTSRYFTGHGPATEYDFAWWAGVTVGVARRGIDLAGITLMHETIGGVSYWSGTTSTAAKPAPGKVYLLPAYDEYTVAYRDRSPIIDDADLQHANTDNRYGVLGPVIVIGGRIAGTWKRTFTKNGVRVETLLFAPVSNARQTALAAAARRYATFVGLALID